MKSSFSNASTTAPLRRSTANKYLALFLGLFPNILKQMWASLLQRRYSKPLPIAYAMTLHLPVLTLQPKSLQWLYHTWPQLHREMILQTYLCSTVDSHAGRHFPMTLTQRHFQKNRLLTENAPLMIQAHYQKLQFHMVGLF